MSVARRSRGWQSKQADGGYDKAAPGLSARLREGSAMQFKGPTVRASCSPLLQTQIWQGDRDTDGQALICHVLKSWHCLGLPGESGCWGRDSLMLLSIALLPVTCTCIHPSSSDGPSRGGVHEPKERSFPTLLLCFFFERKF